MSFTRKKPPHVRARKLLDELEVAVRDGSDTRYITFKFTKTEQAILQISSRPIYAALAKRYASLLKDSPKTRHPLPWPPPAKPPEPWVEPTVWNKPKNKRGRRSNAPRPSYDICPSTGLPIPPKQQGD